MNKDIQRASSIRASLDDNLKKISLLINDVNYLSDIRGTFDLGRLAIGSVWIKESKFLDLMHLTGDVSRQIKELNAIGINRYRNIGFQLYESVANGLYTQLILAADYSCCGESILEGMGLDIKSKLVSIDPNSDEYTDVIRAFALPCDNRNIHSLLDRCLLNMLVYMRTFEVLDKYNTTCTLNRKLKLGHECDAAYICKCVDKILAVCKPKNVDEVIERAIENVECSVYELLAASSDYDPEEDDLYDELETQFNEFKNLFDLFLSWEAGTSMLQIYSKALEYINSGNFQELWLLDTLDAICIDILNDLMDEIASAILTLLIKEGGVDSKIKLKLVKSLCVIIRTTMFGV